MYRINKLDEILETPHVLLAHEDNGIIRVFDASSTEALFRSCLALLIERFEKGIYIKPDKPELTEPELSKDAIEKLPDGEVKELAKKQWLRYDRRQGVYEAALEDYEDIARAVQNKNGRAAYMILFNHRIDYEYERVELVRLESGFIED